MIHFTRHAHDRLMERHAAVLDVAECLEVSMAIEAAIGDQAFGSAECEIEMRDGRLRFVAVVECERRCIVTIIHRGRKNPAKKLWKKKRQQNRKYHQKNQRDYRRMHARKSEISWT